MLLTVILDSLGGARDDGLNGIVGFIAGITTRSSGAVSFSIISRRFAETVRGFQSFLAWIYRWLLISEKC